MHDYDILPDIDYDVVSMNLLHHSFGLRYRTQPDVEISDRSFGLLHRSSSCNDIVFPNIIVQNHVIVVQDLRYRVKHDIGKHDIVVKLRRSGCQESR
jgi:hypothetical protein